MCLTLSLTHMPTPTNNLRFAWYACPRTGAFVHFTLLSGKQCLAQWMLPGPMPVGRPNVPAPGVWLQVPPSKPEGESVAHGSCQIISEKATTLVAQTVLQAIQAGRMLLHLTDKGGESKTYSLIQLRPGSSAWLLGPVSYYCVPGTSSSTAHRSHSQAPASL